MTSFLLVVGTVALGIALGQYVLYNVIMLLAAILRSPKVRADFVPPLTVIIPAHNEESHIRRKLENVYASDYPRELLEVIVVDDGSIDNTAELVREFEDVRLIQTGERKGKIAAQKLAFEQASNAILAITDATVTTPPDAFHKLAAHMHDSQVGAVSASIAVRNRNTNYVARISQFLFEIQNAQKLGESRLDSTAGLFGQMSLVRREAVGDFATDVIYEDREFGITLRKNGYRSRIEPNVRAEYHAPESLADFSMQKKRNVGAMTQSVVRHPGLLFNPKYGFYGLLIFPEYSLFRILRPYLLAISFLAAFLYCAFFEPAALVPIFSSMLAAVFCFYAFGTMVLAPLTTEPAKFLFDIFAMIPAMALVAAYLATSSVRYFRGDYSSKWKRVKRDPEHCDDENSPS